MTIPILALAIEKERDVVTARQRARQIAELLSFDHQDQVRIATAVSEIARNAFRYASSGRIHVSLEGQVAPQLLRIIISDQGAGIANVDEVLSGRYRSATGMGLGLIGARRLMDQFALDSEPGRGTTVSMGKLLPRAKPALRSEQAIAVADCLAAERPRDVIDEVERQNRELLLALDELRRRQDELERLNEELEDTNRGVVALYAELDEKADHLRRADEMKSKFLSNMSHEFRTPLNSMLALTRLLLDRTDGDLSVEQQRQVSLIRKAAQDLSDLVNDLLDLAKVEAGKIVIRTADFEVTSLFGALRGMLRPLLVGESVNLVFEDPINLPTLHTDEAKVSQILRNFISNALKFTERGEVRVSARVEPAGDAVTFSVSDTGIGLPPEEHERIFQEFTQLEHPVQKRVQGTGLGLPLSRKLAELLGGRLTLTSQFGIGSTFSAIVPVQYAGEQASPVESLDASWTPDPGRVPVLIVEDAPDALLVYEHVFRNTPFQILPAGSVRDAKRALQRLRPFAIILDIVLQGEDAWKFLADLKNDDAVRAIPVYVISTIDDRRKGLALGADDYAVKPIEARWLLDRLEARLQPRRTVLLIDDDPAARYVLRKHFSQDWTVLEAANGLEGLRLARLERPSVIFLDLVMPGLSGAAVLQNLRADASTSAIPVIIATSQHLQPAEQAELTGKAAAFFPKELLSSEGAASHVRDALARAGADYSSSAVAPS
jgi:signal transduction histidine kinase/DNA-binding response OmpR family regulator